MIKCRTCADFWDVGPDGPATLPHPCCASHPWAASDVLLETGQGPLEAFGYLRDDPWGPFVAYARGRAYAQESLSDERAARKPRSLYGTAADTDRARAGTKAVIELLERGCAFIRPRAPLRYGSPREIGIAETGAGAPDTPRWWVEARSLCDDRIRPVEAARYILASCGGRGDSTGLAVGTDLAGAVGHGLREVVERSAVRQMANRRLPVRHCAADTPYATALRRDGWTVETVETTHLGFPIALCAATSTAGLSVGGCAAGSGSAHALESATAEAFMKSIAWTTWKPRGKGNTRTAGAARPASTRARRTSARAAGVHGFRLSEALVLGDPPEPAAGDAVHVLAASGADVMFVDRSNPLLDALGLRAVHVLLALPGPQPPPRRPRDPRLEELLR